MTDDGSLLRRYLAERSEAAFTELVERHLGAVYSAALRSLDGNSARAQDVTQRVFIDLARKAKSLSGRQSLAGWLHISARQAAYALKRSEQRREQREEESLLMNTNASESSESDWHRLEPVVDAVLDELESADREIILLRFFQRLSFSEIGALLQLTDDTAQKRASRALEKMRSRLVRRGITSSSAALGAIFTAHGLLAVPAGLTAVSITTAVTATSLTGLSIVGATFMTMKTVTIGLASTVAVMGLIGVTWQHRENQSLSQELATLQQTSARAEIQANQNLKHERERYEKQIAAIQRADTVASRVPVPPNLANTNLRPSDARQFSSSKANPRATANTVRAAMEGGDPKALLEAIVIAPQGRQFAEEAYNRLPADKRAQYQSPEGLMAELLCATTARPQASSEILSEELPGAQGPGTPPNDDPTYQTLHTRTVGPDGKIKETYQVFQQTDDGWRWVISQGLTLKRLLETGLMAAPPPVPKK